MLWLLAHTNDLEKFNWSNRNMSKQFYTLEQVLFDVLDEPSLCVDKDFMMNVLNAAAEIMPEFKEFCQHKYSEKTKRVI